MDKPRRKRKALKYSSRECDGTATAAPTAGLTVSLVTGHEFTRRIRRYMMYSSRNTEATSRSIKETIAQHQRYLAQQRSKPREKKEVPSRGKPLATPRQTFRTTSRSPSHLPQHGGIQGLHRQHKRRARPAPSRLTLLRRQQSNACAYYIISLLFVDVSQAPAREPHDVRPLTMHFKPPQPWRRPPKKLTRKIWPPWKRHRRQTCPRRRWWGRQEPKTERR